MNVNIHSTRVMIECLFFSLYSKHEIFITFCISFARYTRIVATQDSESEFLIFSSRIPMYGVFYYQPPLTFYQWSLIIFHIFAILFNQTGGSEKKYRISFISQFRIAKCFESQEYYDIVHVFRSEFWLETVISIVLFAQRLPNL